MFHAPHVSALVFERCRTKGSNFNTMTCKNLIPICLKILEAPCVPRTLRFNLPRVGSVSVSQCKSSGGRSINVQVTLNNAHEMLTSQEPSFKSLVRPLNCKSSTLNKANRKSQPTEWLQAIQLLTIAHLAACVS